MTVFRTGVCQAITFSGQCDACGLLRLLNYKNATLDFSRQLQGGKFLCRDCLLSYRNKPDAFQRLTLNMVRLTFSAEGFLLHNDEHDGPHILGPDDTWEDYLVKLLGLVGGRVV